jgi:hypothetical protein
MSKQELDHGYYVAQKSTAVYKERNARGSRKRRLALKLEVLTHYGPAGKLQCAWPYCDVVDDDMLSLDHINNDGYADRIRMTGSNSGGGQALYRRVQREGFPDGFQTLCCNHQMKKELLRKRVVHEERWKVLQEQS